MKILVLNGSPKAQSDTMVLTRSFLRGLTAAENCDVTKEEYLREVNKSCQ